MATAVRRGPALPHVFVSRRTFQMVGTSWQGRGRVDLRARGVGGGWTRWVGASQEAPAWTGPSRRVELRARGRVRDLRVTFITTPKAAGLASHAVLPAVSTRPAIITRAGWHADESLRRGPPEYAPALRMVFVHHTVTATAAPCSESARIVRGIYAYHVLTNGWNDIGYNFLVDKCGQVFEGRYGGMTAPVIGAQTKGLNTGSAGIAVIGTYSSRPPPAAGLRALERLIAWRLDVAHVNPRSWTWMKSSGNPRYPPGRHVLFHAISGHRDGSPTSCPGTALYRLLPGIRRAVARIGLPKIWSPEHHPGLRRLAPDAARPVRFTATLSTSLRSILTIRGPAGGIVARHAQRGAQVEWTWPGRLAVLRGGDYRWNLRAPGTLPFVGSLGSLPRWRLRAPPDGFTVASGAVTGGDLASLQHPDGNVLSIDSAGKAHTALVADLGIATTRPVAAAAASAGASATTLQGGRVTVALWDFRSSKWIPAGSCVGRPRRACKVERFASAHSFTNWDAGSSKARMRVRYNFPGAVDIDTVHVFLRG